MPVWQKYILPATTAIICCIILLSCTSNTNNKTGNDTLIIQQKAEKISNVFISLLYEIKKIADYTESLYTSNNKQNKLHDVDLYKTLSNGTLHKYTDDGKSSVYVPEFTKMNNEIITIINNTNPLDSVFKKHFEIHYPLVSQIYYLEKNSIIRMYPYTDLVSQFESDVDITTYNFYYLADKQHNPKKESVLINRPYADPAGRGWMVSCIAPVYIKSELKGVVGADITLQSIAEFFFTPDTCNLMIVDSSGIALYYNDKTANLLMLPKIIEYKYLQTINEDIYLPERYNVLRNKNKKVRIAFDELFGKKIATTQCLIHSKSIELISCKIPNLPWYLIKVNSIE